jgi:trehalose/maltose hydrolase-like predicted phosphorylase
MNNPDFQIKYESYDPQQQPLRESLCTLGNGYFATRGAHESTKAGGAHYPGTYLAGGYDRLDTEIAGKIIVTEDLVNWPNWLFLTFRIDDSDWFSLEQVQIIEYRQVLHLRQGLLELSMRFRDRHDRETSINSRRLVHMNEPHLAAIQWILTPENWSGSITVHSAIDGTVTNSGVARYRELNGEHLKSLHSGLIFEESIYLEVRSRQSHIHMAQATRTIAYQDDMPMPVQRETTQREGYIAQELTFGCKRGHPVRIEKVAAIYTSRDMAISEPVLEARNALQTIGTFNELLKSHITAWEELWDCFDITIKGDSQTQQILRLHIFHILQTASPNTYDLDVGIPPRGLHGEAYRGHIMWDELFAFSFLNFRNPLLTRKFLLYRYRRLGQARLAARKAGYRGAMFPWQSGSNGREESQEIHLNPQSGRWVTDNTQLQRHVSAAIAYNIWQYFQTTDDKEFMYFFGAEMLFEIAKFWASIARFNSLRQRFEIHNVIGPDEYHTRYPNAQTPGINNNAYTNIMAAWVLMRSLDTINILDKKRKHELLRNLQIDSEEIDRWKHISTTMYVPILDGIIEQFENYSQLEELDWPRYREMYGDNMRLDRILEAEGDSVNRYKAGKQADALMIFYLFSAEEITEIFDSLNYHFDTGSIPQTIEYYHKRTSHGSTLSRMVFSWVLARANRKHSWHAFEKALISDLKDVQGGTTSEGIHLGAMAGTADIMQRCYTGLEAKGDELHFNPQLPQNITEIKQRLRYRSHWIDIVLNHEQMTITIEKGWGNPVIIRVRGEKFNFTETAAKTFYFK